MEQIEVEILANEALAIPSIIHWEGFVIRKLKAAGMPLKGCLLYGGLTSGTLHRIDDPCDFGKVKYVWTPDA